MAQPWLHNLDYLAFSGIIKAVKPDPAAFNHCVTALHAAPEDFLFVDDREANAHAAHALGMTGHVFTGLADLAETISTWLVLRQATFASSLRRQMRGTIDSR